MAKKKDVNEVTHNVSIKLYETHLNKIKGRFIARTDVDKSLNLDIPRICDSMITRGNYVGNRDFANEAVIQFFDEAIFLLLDGYTLNFKYFTLRQNIGGSFDNERSEFDPSQHPISIRFRTLAALREKLKHIKVENKGPAGTTAFIREFIDYQLKVKNDYYEPGNMFRIKGRRIQLAGDHSAVGVYFVPVDSPSDAVKVTLIGENTPTRITGIAPNTSHVRNRIEIRTQYASSDHLLDELRVITSSFVLEAL